MPVQVWHPPVEIPNLPAPDLKASTHRSRKDLERVLADHADAAAWDDLVVTYDEMAAEWTEWAREQPWYAAAVSAGMAHARPVRWLLEVGCGTGQATEVLSKVGPAVIATDVNVSMLRGAPALPRVSYVAADVRRLPLATGSAPMIVALNGVPDLAEFARVLPVGGQLLWCTSFGPGTPLYVPPDRLADLLGPQWATQAGRAGHGDWLLATRM
ncbi:MAG: class I SAM-dependent methyltransferase [Hamadaea sp.]|nr:class I SAM-dependent methyltransferase [Hamadaea sp.]